MKLPRFQYFAPNSIGEASSLLANYGKDAYALAGGTDLLVKMKQRRLVPGYVVNLKTIPGLDYITFDESGGLRMGPLVTIQAIKSSASIRRNYKVLSEAAGVESSVQIRNRATIGGNIANSSPAADAPLGLIVHGAGLVITGPAGEREILLEYFSTGPGANMLKPGELIAAVKFPIPAAAGYAKVQNAASRFALVGVFVARFPSGVRVAVTGAAPVVFRVPSFEAALAARFEPAAVKGYGVDPAGLNSDIHAEAAFRAHLISVMAKRAVAAARAAG